jgi:hypothetical protein
MRPNDRLHLVSGSPLEIRIYRASMPILAVSIRLADTQWVLIKDIYFHRIMHGEKYKPNDHGRFWFKIAQPSKWFNLMRYPIPFDIESLNLLPSQKQNPFYPEHSIFTFRETPEQQS